MTHFIEFTIGDWSDDGHGESESWIVKSNVPVQELREAHFAATGKGIDIGKIAAEYEFSEASEEGLMEQLIEAEILRASNPFLEPVWEKLMECITPESLETIGTENVEITYDGNRALEEPEDIIRIWVAILAHFNPSFQLEIIGEESNINSSTEASLALNPGALKLIRGLMESIPVDVENEHTVMANKILAFKSPKKESMHFYGFDKQNRHLNVPGYGIFRF